MDFRPPPGRCCRPPTRSLSRRGVGGLQFAFALHDRLGTDRQRFGHRSHSSPPKRERLIGRPQPGSFSHLNGVAAAHIFLGSPVCVVPAPSSTAEVFLDGRLANHSRAPVGSPFSAGSPTVLYQKLRKMSSPKMTWELILSRLLSPLKACSRTQIANRVFRQARNQNSW